MLINAQNNAMMTDMWDTIMLFINQVMTFISIIDNYKATDFC